MKLRVDENGRECCICGQYKEWSCFNNGANHGHDSRCKDCLAAYRRTPEYRNRNRDRQAVRLANADEREKQNERVRAYYANPEVIARLNTEEAKQARSEYGKIYWKERGKELQKNLPPEEKARRRKLANSNMRKFLTNPRNRLSNRMAAGEIGR